MSKSCSTCLKPHENLVGADEVGQDNIRWSSKLSLCVPELEWKTDCLLCQSCTHKLQVVYEFRNQCLRSHEIQTTKCKGEQIDLKNESDDGCSLEANERDDASTANVKRITDDIFCVSLDEISTIFEVTGNLCGSVLNNGKLKASKLRDIKNNHNQCKICNQVMDSRRMLLLHVRNKHESDNYCINTNESEPVDFVCFHCNKSFTDKLILTDHIQHVHGSNIETKQCQICKDSFAGQAALENHLILEHRIGETKSSRKAKKHKCSKCSKMYTTEKIMKIHSQSCNGVRRHMKLQKVLENESECENIESKNELNVKPNDIKSDADLLMLLNLGTPSKPPEEKYDISDSIFRGKMDSQVSTEESLDPKLKKMKLKRGRKPKEKQINKCEVCSVVFSTRYLLNRHVRNVHATEKLHNCDICGQKFASPVYLSAHKRYHSRERPHICSFCGKGYITASDLYHHEKIHANKRAYKCVKCPKAFNTSSDLHKHKICVHVDRSEWKYVCSFCERRFPLKTNLDTHTKTHTGERNFACHLCDRRCINRSVLLRHIESHSNVRSFRCGICNQDYKYQKSLDIHMTKAHGIGDAKIPERVKKYFCHICPKSYFANNKLQKHIRTHTGERPFACHMCDKRFIDKSYVKQHLKTAHNVNFSSVP